VNATPFDPTPASLRPIPAQTSSSFDGDDSTWAIAATQRRQTTVQPPPAAPEPSPAAPTDFWPEVPQSFEETGLRTTQVESLVLKFLLNIGRASGREIASQIALPYNMVAQLLHTMKQSQLLALKSDARLGDFTYELTDFGAENGRRYVEKCTYFGAAPVPLEQYAGSVGLQSLRRHSLNPDVVQRAFSDLVVSDSDVGIIGEALNMGRGMFLYGAPGNGKSSLAERISRVFQQHVWIPRALSVGGEILRLFDSIHHIEAGQEAAFDRDQRPHDARWVLVRRPAIIVGGELDLDSFDIATNRVTGINEAPLQLKANCGTLVVDDFGRNRFRPTELLNRLVVPMERGVDYFHLVSGRTFQVPFDSMLIFATNEVPAEIVDEAFLRRVPFKIAVHDPDEQQYRELYRREAVRLHLQTSEDDIEYLLQRHYRQTGRPMRFCHPRDLLQMIANSCQFHGQSLLVTRDGIDQAVGQYVSLRNG
jgi:hypothetical protein